MARRPVEPTLHQSRLPSFAAEFHRSGAKINFETCREGGTPDLFIDRVETGTHEPGNNIQWRHTGEMPDGMKYELSVHSSAIRNKASGAEDALVGLFLHLDAHEGHRQTYAVFSNPNLGWFESGRPKEVNRFLRRTRTEIETERRDVTDEERRALIGLLHEHIKPGAFPLPDRHPSWTDLEKFRKEAEQERVRVASWLKSQMPKSR